MANQGDLFKAGSYKLQEKPSNHHITVPNLFLQNFTLEQSSEAEVFIDFERACIVYDFEIAGDGGGADGD